MDLEETFAIAIPDDDNDRLTTVDAIVGYITEQLMMQRPKTRVGVLKLIRTNIYVVTNPANRRPEIITEATELRTAEGLYILPGQIISLAEHLGTAIGHPIEPQYYNRWQTVGDVANTIASYLRLKK